MDLYPPLVMSAAGRAIKDARSQFLLLRNKDYVAINKPIGLKLISGKQPCANVGKIFDSMGLGSGYQPVPVSSMDAQVSGVAFFSLHPSAGRLARTMIREGKFWRRKYWGLVNGRVAGGHSSGVINIPLDGSVPSANGVPSITHWRLLRYSETERLSLIEFEPRTDVLDQIQLHCKISLRTPLVETTGLHLHKISGCLPGGDDVDITAPPVAELRLSLEKLGFI